MHSEDEYSALLKENEELRAQLEEAKKNYDGIMKFMSRYVLR